MTQGWVVLLSDEVRVWLAALVPRDPETALLSGRSEIRILFVFDPLRRAILLVAGDKSSDWTGWYKHAMKRAEVLYEEHRRAIETRPHER